MSLKYEPESMSLKYEPESMSLRYEPASEPQHMLFRQDLSALDFESSFVVWGVGCGVWGVGCGV
jgi:hypothetical protein